MNTTVWEQPTIAVDVIAYVFDQQANEPRIVLANRQHEPHKGEYALPGVLMLGNERATEAATRAIHTKVHPDAGITYLKDVGISDIPGRDNRGPSLSIIMLAFITLPENLPDTVKLVSPSVAIQTPLPFDHHEMIIRTNHVVEQEFLHNPEFTVSLVGDKFTTATIYNTLNAVKPLNAPQPDKTNLNRSIRSQKWVEKTETSTSTGRGRPSTLWSSTL